MDERFLFLAILLPIIGGVLTPVIGKRSQKALYGWVFAVSIATSLLTWALILTCKTDSYTIVRLTDVLTLTLRFDGLGRFFAGIVATLWPLTVLYASEYMKHEERQAAFFAFFTLPFFCKKY